VDLRDGQVVRLIRGDPRLSKSYSSLGSPIDVAKIWIGEGAKTIHIIDLDAALGSGNNLVTIEEMAKALDVNLQVGGGVRRLDLATRLFDLGVERVIVGTMAFKDRGALIELLKRYGEDKIVVSLDHYGREIMVKGWRVSSKIDIRDGIEDFLNLGARAFLVTSIKRDGTLTSPDFKILREICKIKDAKIIAAGGVSRLEHLSMLRDIGANKVVIGRALYENKFTLRDAINKVKEE
jgi:phosphoribosylformimino-5-aminoimidazole carboxamide ribotide isomerase